MSISKITHANLLLTTAITATSLVYGQPSTANAAETRTYRVT
jgi:hypothetical protein